MSSAPKHLLAACLALLAMSCSPKHDNAQQQQNANSNASQANSNASQNAGVFESGPGLRVACADEIQKYCANDPRRRRCLRDNMDKLGNACKTAVLAPPNPANAHRPGVLRLCADDIQKFCANDPRKFHCLRQDLGQLSETCRAAVLAPRENTGQQGSGQAPAGNPSPGGNP